MARTPVIEHDAARGHFHARMHAQGDPRGDRRGDPQGDFQGECVYRLAGDVMQIVHTEVDPALRGHGVAAALVEAAFVHARANGLKVLPLCSYVRAWVRRNPQVRELLAESR